MQDEISYSWDKENYGYFMKFCKEYKHYTLVDEGYNASLYFYTIAYQKKGYKIDSKEIKNLTTGDTVMVCESNTRNGLNALYHYQSLKEWRSSVMVKIVGRKEYNTNERASYFKNLILSDGSYYAYILSSMRSDSLSAEELISKKANEMVQDEMNSFKISK